MELKHSRLGIWSFALALTSLVGICFLMLLVIRFFPELRKFDGSGVTFLLGLTSIFLTFLSVISIFLSTASFFQKECKKLYAYLGLIISFLILLSVYVSYKNSYSEIQKIYKSRYSSASSKQSNSTNSLGYGLQKEEREERLRQSKLAQEKQEKLEKEQLKVRKIQEQKERLFDAKVEHINTHGTIQDVVSSNGGRKLVFLLKGAETSIQVFDTEQENFTAKLVLQTSRVHIAANSEYVFVANVNDNSLTKLAIKDLKELSKITLISKGSISNITAASDSATAPIGVIAGEQFKFYNAKTLREIKTSWFSENYNRELSNGLDRRIYEGAKLRSSPNGKFFTFWNLNVSPTGVNLISIENVGSELNAVLNNEHTTAGYLSPINNGSVYTNFNGIYNQDLKVISSEDFKNNHLIPVQGSDAFISIMISRENTRGLVINGGSEEVLTNLGELYMMHNTDHKYSFHKQEINPDQRYFWYPKQNKLIVIPYINNEIVSIKYK